MKHMEHMGNVENPATSHPRPYLIGSPTKKEMVSDGFSCTLWKFDPLRPNCFGNYGGAAPGIPSGKLSHNYGKSPFLMGKSAN